MAPAARSISRFLSPEDALKAEAGPLEFLSSAPMGGAYASIIRGGGSG